MMRRLVVVVCVLAVSALAAAPAVAQNTQTITAIGSAQVAVKPKNRTDNASIAYAVKAASIQAIPLAIAAARDEGGRLAAAAGLLLGPIESVSENTQPFSPFGPFPVPSFAPVAFASSGPGEYCGTITRPIVRRDASGRRRVVRLVKERRCNVPPFASVAVAVTFSAAPPPPPAPCVVAGTCPHG
jgi:uncharacterized protein YggE